MFFNCFFEKTVQTLKIGETAILWGVVGIVKIRCSRKYIVNHCK